MQSELIEQNQADMKGDTFFISVPYPRDNHLKDNPYQYFKATSDPDTIYLHDAMKETDRKEFITVMVNEVTYQMYNWNYSIIPKS